MKFLPLIIAPLALGHLSCESLVSHFVGEFADIHDEDEKSLSIKKHTVHITPHGNKQKWEIKAKVDSDSCAATVDFNVPGKDDHPPVPLQALFLHMTEYYPKHPGGVQMAVGFSDPSGTLKTPGYPLNHWAAVGKAKQEPSRPRPCPTKLDAIFADMHDGDEKRVQLSGDKMKITSNNKTEKWVVHAKVDHHCRAVIDFNVPGKPSPPPVNLTVSMWQARLLNRYSEPDTVTKTVLEFTDPSATLADAGYPLNHWVELKDGFDPYVPPVARGKCCYGFPGADNWKGCNSATACPSNPACESKGRCEGECRGSWCNDGADDEVSV